jgi:hypothetical protein
MNVAECKNSLFQDIKGIIISRKSKKNRQYNGKKNRTSNHIQNTTQKAKDLAIRASLYRNGG